MAIKVLQAKYRMFLDYRILTMEIVLNSVQILIHTASIFLLFLFACVHFIYF